MNRQLSTKRNSGFFGQTLQLSYPHDLKSAFIIMRNFLNQDISQGSFEIDLDYTSCVIPVDYRWYFVSLQFKEYIRRYCLYNPLWNFISHFKKNDDAFEMIRTMMPPSIHRNSPRFLEEIDSWQGNTVFIGRINAKSVTEGILREELNRIRGLQEVDLRNDVIVEMEEFPKDLFATARFSATENTLRCLKHSDGKIFFVRRLKCFRI